MYQQIFIHSQDLAPTNYINCKNVSIQNEPCDLLFLMKTCKFSLLIPDNKRSKVQSDGGLVVFWSTPLRDADRPKPLQWM